MSTPGKYSQSRGDTALSVVLKENISVSDGGQNHGQRRDVSGVRREAVGFIHYL
ncbi:Hypothetical predicted protein [Xyrichtys novacula]|uniref:Uncharacterized protein n=1 Tax=Xyrichtys novacula TaxID=13765 RepID=A0AAV1GVC6_XYRNO|nr:Hypothetical predicted protein [Xyrichtys novacula]